MAEYTPSEAEIELAWMAEVSGEPSGAGYGKVLHRERQAAFERGIERIKAEVRAEERAKFDAEVAMLRRSAKTLGTQLERAGRAIQEAVNRPDLINGDGEGDWELVFELLAGLRPRAESAEQALVDERAKRPDREELEAQAEKRYPAGHAGYSDRGSQECLCDECCDTEQKRLAYMEGVDAVLSSLALEPEAREEPDYYDTHCSTCEVRGPQHNHMANAPAPEAREVTDAEANIDTRLLVLGAGAGQRFVGPFPNNSSALNWAREYAPDVTYVSSVMWPQPPDDAAAVTDG